MGAVMKKLVQNLLAPLILIGLWSAQAQATVIPAIQSASVNYSGNTLVLKGRNFGANPTVVFGNQALATQSASGTQIVAKFAVDAPALSYAPGTYVVVASMVGYAQTRVTEVAVAANENSKLELALRPQLIQMKGITV
jgi:hypothetical protein